MLPASCGLSGAGRRDLSQVAERGVLVPGEPVGEERLAEPEVIDARQVFGL